MPRSAKRAGEAKVMAGGQSLIPVLKLRIASVGTVVDINRVAGLDAIEERTVSSASARSSATRTPSGRRS